MHINWAALAQLSTGISIIFSAWKVWHSIDNLRGEIKTGLWEHKVMWAWHRRHNPVPDYPNTEVRND